MQKYRTRFVERIHEDGVMAFEVVVSAEDRLSGIARATMMLPNELQRLTWVEWSMPEAQYAEKEEEK